MTTRTRLQTGSHRSRAPQRPQPVDGTVAGAPTPNGLLHLQRTAGNQAVVQRVKDLFDWKLEKEKLKLSGDFAMKHAGDSEEDAKNVTAAREAKGKMPAPMKAGHLANTVAPRATWLSALDASDTKVDTERPEWTDGVSMKVGKAFQVRRLGPGNFSVGEVSDLSLTAGGYAEPEYAEGRKGRKGAKQVTGGAFLINHVGNKRSDDEA